jgi:hypothetical protein
LTFKTYPIPINVPELRVPRLDPYSAKDPGNAFVGLIEAISKSKEGTEEDKCQKMKQEGQKSCDRFNK